jgi:hypothetical protein
MRAWLKSAVTYGPASKAGLRGGGADSALDGKSGLQGLDSVSFGDIPINPASRLPKSNGGATLEADAGQAPDNKGRSNVRVGPPTSAFHITKLKVTAVGGVPQEVVEEPRSNTAAVGEKMDCKLPPEIVVNGPVPDVSPIMSSVEWQHGTPTTSVLRTVISHPQGLSTPVSPIDCSMTPARWDRSGGARIGRDRGGSISSITEANFHRDDRK